MVFLRGVTLIYKVVVPIQKENGRPLVSETRGQENEEEISPPHPIQGWKSFDHELSQRGPGGVPDENGFYCNLISADKLPRQQMKVNVSPFHGESKKWEVPVPLYPCKLRLWISPTSKGLRNLL